MSFAPSLLRVGLVLFLATSCSPPQPTAMNHEQGRVVRGFRLHVPAGEWQVMAMGYDSFGSGEFPLVPSNSEPQTYVLPTPYTIDELPTHLWVRPIHTSNPWRPATDWCNAASFHLDTEAGRATPRFHLHDNRTCFISP